jgi:hypothetical protein
VAAVNVQPAIGHDGAKAGDRLWQRRHDRNAGARQR